MIPSDQQKKCQEFRHLDKKEEIKKLEVFFAYLVKVTSLAKCREFVRRVSRLSRYSEQFWGCRTRVDIFTLIFLTTLLITALRIYGLKNINLYSLIHYPSLFSENEYMCLKISCHWVPYQIDRWLWWSVFQTLETELSALVITYWDCGQRYFLFLYQNNIFIFCEPHHFLYPWFHPFYVFSHIYTRRLNKHIIPG